jgi:hypothetical protein
MGERRSQQILRALAKAREDPALDDPGSHQATRSALGTTHSGIAAAACEDRGVWKVEQNALGRLPLFQRPFCLLHEGVQNAGTFRAD